ncbi:MAG: hypothetical protein RLZZ369_890 [Pseudomonadota bacterium]
MTQLNALPPQRRSLSDWLIGLPTMLLLMLVLVIGTGEMIHGQLLRLGESMFGDPANQVRCQLERGCRSGQTPSQRIYRQQPRRG